MKITVTKALELLNKAKQYGNEDSHRWIKHSICVGDTAATIAKALSLDSEYAKALGYIHDIGKTNKDNYDWHDVDGYNLLVSEGIDKEDAMICLTHSYIKGDVDCVAGGYVPSHPLRDIIKTHTYNIYEEIINLCDLMCTTEVMTMEKRLIDLLIRKGIHENTKYHLESSLKLKEEFDILLGYNIYKLFPNILNI